VAYAIVTWLLIEVASFVLPALHLPDWTLTFLVFLFAIGFPLALALAWAFELTPAGPETSHLGHYAKPRPTRARILSAVGKHPF
jgi:hypothetical protein